MALPVSRFRVPNAPKSAVSTIVRCKSTVVPAATSMVDAKSRVREHARHISRTTVSNATPAPTAYVLIVSPLFSPQKNSDFYFYKSSESNTWNPTDAYTEHRKVAFSHLRSRSST